MTATTTTQEATPLLAITLPGTRYTAWMARYHVRAALKQHDLYGYADDAAEVTSELATNAIIHTDPEKIGLELTYEPTAGELSIVVTDPSSDPPEKRDLADAAECGRGLILVDALSLRWGWEPRHPGKAVYAVLTAEA